MLAATGNPSKFPILVSPKIDGIRCIVRNGKLVSRALIEFQNRALQAKFANLPDGIDGELIVGLPTDKEVFKSTTKAVMSHDGDVSDVRFYVFDYLPNLEAQELEFQVRQGMLKRTIEALHHDAIVQLEHVYCMTQEELMSLEETWVVAGYEGVIARWVHGPYKFGRATEREGFMSKIKRWNDSEAIVVGLVEQMHNVNEQTRDNLGYTKRSSSKAGKTPAGTMGALKCRLASGIEFELGSGFSAADRRNLWDDGDQVIGRIVCFKFQMLSEDGVPRFPIWKGFRHRDDMDEDFCDRKGSM